VERIAKAMTDQWWLVILRGVLAVLFGVSAWIWPGLTILTLVILFGAYALVGGVMNLGAAFAQRRMGSSPWPFVFQGVLGIAVGIVVAVWPDISALSLLYVIAAWAFVAGVFEVVTAVALRKMIENEWLLGLSGAVALLFGVGIAVYPGIGTLLLLSAIAAYAIIAGIMQVVLGLRLRRLNAARQQAART